MPRPIDLLSAIFVDCLVRWKLGEFPGEIQGMSGGRCQSETEAEWHLTIDESSIFLGVGSTEQQMNPGAHRGK
jgi:hypothetical protein